MTVLVLAAPGPAAGWPISQPSAADGKARSAYVGSVTDDESGSVVTAAGFAAVLASAVGAVAETDITGRTGALLVVAGVQAVVTSPQMTSAASTAGSITRPERRRMAAAFAVGNSSYRRTATGPGCWNHVPF
jgi:hypothetical protein